MPSLNRVNSKVLSWCYAISLLLAFSFVLLLSACQWMEEFRTPGGFVRFDGLSPDKATAAYAYLTQYLQQAGFGAIGTDSPESAFPLDGLFGGEPSGYFKDFIFNERANPFVISLQFDMNAGHTAVSYQIREYERIDGNRMRPRLTDTISAEGCGIITTVSNHFIEQLGADYLVYNGIPKCVTSSR